MRPTSSFGGEKKIEGSHGVSLLWPPIFAEFRMFSGGKKRENILRTFKRSYRRGFFKEVTRYTQKIQLWAVYNLENTKELQNCV